ncbi:MAG TPA: hypothetical protein ENN40_00260 [Candidatus Aminicenantes bacterium]|nr:hypothetical protein [Candidatus Aminicenantes bacterium]
MKHAVISISLVLAMAVFLPAQNRGEDETFRAKYYENAKVVRVKYVDGEAFVDRSYDEGQEEVTINLPLFEKDMVETTDGRMEIYLGRLNYLRLDYDTRIDLEKLPALRHTSLTMNIRRGGVYMDVNSLEYERDMEIQTPDCGVFLLGRGVLRINVIPGEGTEVVVQEGLVEVAGSSYNRDLRSGQKVVFLNGDVRESPFYFRTALNDDFDQWHRRRDQQLGVARYGTSRYLDEGYSDYEYELSRHGRWSFNTTYNRHIWIPHHLMSGWRPYYHGRWVWNPYYGYVWTSYDPWGWFTHHYGRWHWDGGMGWHWIPGYRWSPAWVAWYWGDSYYGWTPLSYWNRPVFVYNNRWHRDYHYWKGLPRNSLSTVIIRKDRLLASHIHQHATNRPGTRAVIKHTIPFRGSAPNVRPQTETVRVINAKGRDVLVKRGALASPARYQTQKEGLMTRKVTPQRVQVANRYTKGNETREPVIRNYGRDTSNQRIVRRRTTSDERTTTTHRYRGSSDPKTSTSRTTVQKKTTTTATGKRSTTVRKRTSSSKTSESKDTKKAKRKEDSPAYSPTAHSHAPSGTSTSRYSSSSRHTTAVRQPLAPIPQRYQPRTNRNAPTRSYTSPRSSLSVSGYVRSVPERYSRSPANVYSSRSRSSATNEPRVYSAPPSRTVTGRRNSSSYSTRSYRSSSSGHSYSGSRSSHSRSSSRSSSSAKARRR